MIFLLLKYSASPLQRLALAFCGAVVCWGIPGMDRPGSGFLSACGLAAGPGVPVLTALSLHFQLALVCAVCSLKHFRLSPPCPYSPVSAPGCSLPGPSCGASPCRGPSWGHPPSHLCRRGVCLSGVCVDGAVQRGLVCPWMFFIRHYIFKIEPHGGTCSGSSFLALSRALLRDTLGLSPSLLESSRVVSCLGEYEKGCSEHPFTWLFFFVFGGGRTLLPYGFPEENCWSQGVRMFILADAFRTVFQTGWDSQRLYRWCEGRSSSAPSPTRGSAALHGYGWSPKRSAVA